MNEICPGCGTQWRDGITCEAHFHQMLYWEHENPANWEVHHLMVLCYHLQHPSLYAPDGLATSKNLLVTFVDGGVSPQEVRVQSRDIVDSGKRKFKITATPDLHGAYANPIRWSMTTADVIDAGIDGYIDSGYAWAKSTLEALKSSGNLD